MSRHESHPATRRQFLHAAALGCCAGFGQRAWGAELPATHGCLQFETWYDDSAKREQIIESQFESSRVASMAAPNFVPDDLTELVNQSGIPSQSGGPVLQTEAIFSLSRGWFNQKQVTYQFVDREFSGEQLVEKAFEEWHPHCGLDFKPVGTGGEIKITFRQNLGHYSYVGTDSKRVTGPTMNIGNDIYRRAVVLHEVGHAIGLVHEHLHVGDPIEWDTTLIFDYFWIKYRWDEAKVRLNVLDKARGPDYAATARRDSRSIMHYWFEKKLIKNHAVVPSKPNESLTLSDKNFVRKMYGRPLLEGDDSGTDPARPEPPLATDFRDKLKASDAIELALNSPKTGSFTTDKPLVLYKVKPSKSAKFYMETVEDKPLPVRLELFTSDSSFKQANAVEVKRPGTGRKLLHTAIARDLSADQTYFVLVGPATADNSGEFKIQFVDAQSSSNGPAPWADRVAAVEKHQEATKKTLGEIADLQKQLRGVK